MNYQKQCLKYLFLFLFAIGMSLNLDGQAPGGVKNPVLWEKTWEANSQDEHGSALFNYHPYKFFTEDRGYSELPISGLKKMSLFVVFSSDNPTEIGRIQTGSSEVVLTDTTVVSRRSIKYKKLLKPKFISYIESFPGGSIATTDQPHFLVGSKKINDEWYQGGIAEVIMYDRLISKSQRLKVESYLSLKYGISLPDSSSYYRSDGTVIREGSSLNRYKHNLTGIGRDDASGLYQKQSHNLYSDVDLTIGIGQLGEMNRKNAGAFKNHNYLLWSDDDGAAKFESKETSVLSRTELSRKWEINSIGDNMQEIPMTVQLSLANIIDYNPDQKLWLVVSDSDVGIYEDSATEYFEMKKGKYGLSAEGVLFDKNGSGTDYITFVQMAEEKTDTRNLGSDILYPNPVGTNSDFILSLSDYNEENLTVSIYDALGQLVRQQNYDTGKSFIYTDKLKLPGTYLLKVEGDKTNDSYKLIVQ